MEGLVAALIAVLISQFAFLWYRIGRLEGILKEHCKETRRGNNDHRGGKA